MCMIVERPFPEIDGTEIEKKAGRDIPCWKIVEYVTDRDGNPVAVTPYRFAHLDETVLEGIFPYEASGDKDVKRGRCGRGLYLIVDKGYVHCFAEPDRSIVGDLMFLLKTVGQPESCLADAYAAALPNTDPCPEIKGYALYRCVIPEGALYIKGHSDGEYESPNYASERVVYKERVAYWDRYDADDVEALESDVRAVVECEAAEAETGKEDSPCA